MKSTSAAQKHVAFVNVNVAIYVEPLVHGRNEPRSGIRR
jgi:hypothetical protein